MSKRKRDYIPLGELLAAALANSLPPEVERDLRERKVPAVEVIRLFTPDHIHLHALDGSDDWWNLHMRQRGTPEILAKNASDTTVVAKTRRIEKKWFDFTAAMAAGKKPPKRPARKGRKLQSRNTLRRSDDEKRQDKIRRREARAAIKKRTRQAVRSRTR